MLLSTSQEQPVCSLCLSVSCRHLVRRVLFQLEISRYTVQRRLSNINDNRYLPLHMAITHDVCVDKTRVLLQYCQEMILADTEERRGLRALLMAANTRVPDYRNLEDEEAYFLAMAKAKLRKQHYNPTPEWTFVKIVQLVERNPLDEALIQRALYATNEKLRTMNDAEEQHCNQDDNRKGYGAVVDTVTLNSDLMLVRTVHQVMFEFPNNPRLQLLGQAILTKLLPSAYVRAAYKAKIDPYFNL
ncbi:hypothetical protein GQ600_27143 [Phytophthora cactorum]|nr:hypothetical protein GQ600_27143 [Phytophthora cactorum]